MRQIYSITAEMNAFLALALVLPFPTFTRGVTFVGTAPGQIWWQWVGFIVMVIFLTLLALPVILVWQRNRHDKVLRIEIINRGNVRSCYILQVSESSGDLDFAFSANGVPLRRPTRVVSGELVSAQPVSPKTSSKSLGTKGVVSDAMQTGGVLADFLTMLGTILPSPLGQSAVRLGNNIRRGKAFDARARRTLNRAGQLKPGGGAIPSEPRRASHTPSVASSNGSLTVQPGAQTDFVESGQKLLLDLSVNPWSPYKTRHYSLTLKSWAVERKNAQVVQKYDIEIDGLSAFERYVPFLILLAGILILLIVFLSLLR